MIVADTSVWIDHLRQENALFAQRLEEGVIAVHPWVIGELACGGLRHRQHILNLLRSLYAAPVASYDEVMHLIERRKLMGRGIGWTDAHLVAGCIVGRMRLWTLDMRLRAVADALGVGLK
jgi:predicted nucleic acid-binding protein